MYQKIHDEISQDSYKIYPNDGQRFVAWYLRNIHILDTFETKDCITDGRSSDLSRRQADRRNLHR